MILGTISRIDVWTMAVSAVAVIFSILGCNATDPWKEWDNMSNKEIVHGNEKWNEIFQKIGFVGICGVVVTVVLGVILFVLNVIF